jgi:hypothetical protein
MGLFGYGRYKPVAQLQRLLMSCRIPVDMEYMTNQSPFLVFPIRDGVQCRMFLMGGVEWWATFVQHSQLGLPLQQTDVVIGPVGIPLEALMRQVVATAPPSPVDL